MYYETVKNTIEEILQKLSVDFEGVELVENDIYPIFLIKTKDSGVLIGNKGESLQALSYLVKKIIENKTEEGNPFLLDVNGYQNRKIKELKNKAYILAERARLFKYDVEMSPMNAYERMIVHATFSNDPNITTESEGEGKHRHVVIKYTAS